MLIPKDDILPVFFKAMVEGYAGNAEKTTILELPGSRVIQKQYGQFMVTDCYFTTALQNESAGSITIHFDQIPVWVMQYSGWYEKEVIPVLKEALLQTYRDGVFAGGRGRSATLKVEDRVYAYNNHVELGNWRRFQGSEEILFYPQSGYPQQLGKHSYSGLLLV